MKTIVKRAEIVLEFENFKELMKEILLNLAYPLNFSAWKEKIKIEDLDLWSSFLNYLEFQNAIVTSGNDFGYTVDLKEYLKGTTDSNIFNHEQLKIISKDDFSSFKYGKHQYTLGEINEDNIVLKYCFIHNSKGPIDFRILTLKRSCNE